MSHIEPRVPLEVLDPAQGEAGYWIRFQGRVMRSVDAELARRRGSLITMGDVMLSWSRLVVPFTATAAALAALVLIQPPPPEDLDGVAGLEERLLVPQDGMEPLPAFLYTDTVVDRDLVLFAVEGF